MYYTHRKSYYDVPEHILKYIDMESVPKPPSKHMAESSQAQISQFTVKYGDPLRQQTVRGLTTMDKPVTPPVSCYEIAIPTIHHLNLAEIIGDPTTIA